MLHTLDFYIKINTQKPTTTHTHTLTHTHIFNTTAQRKRIKPNVSVLLHLVCVASCVLKIAFSDQMFHSGCGR